MVKLPTLFKRPNCTKCVDIEFRRVVDTSHPGGDRSGRSNDSPAFDKQIGSGYEIESKILTKNINVTANGNNVKPKSDTAKPQDIGKL